MFRGSKGYMLSKNRPDEGTLVNWQSCKPLWAIHYCPSVLMYVVERDSWPLHIFVGVVLLTLPADGFTADLIQRWSLRATRWMYYALQTPELSSYTKSFCLSLSNTRVHAGHIDYVCLWQTHTQTWSAAPCISCVVWPHLALLHFPGSSLPVSTHSHDSWVLEEWADYQCMHVHHPAQRTHILSLIHTSAVTHFLCVFTAQGCIKLIESQSEDIYNVTKIYF